MTARLQPFSSISLLYEFADNNTTYQTQTTIVFDDGIGAIYDDEDMQSPPSVADFTERFGLALPNQSSFRVGLGPERGATSPIFGELVFQGASIFDDAARVDESFWLAGLPPTGEMPGVDAPVAFNQLKLKGYSSSPFKDVVAEAMLLNPVESPIALEDMPTVVVQDPITDPGDSFPLGYDPVFYRNVTASSAERYDFATGAYETVTADLPPVPYPADDPASPAGPRTVFLGSLDDDEIATGGLFDLIDGGAGNDQIVGAATAETIHGSGGDDRITGEGGNDTIRGNGGDDALMGGAGADRVHGQRGEDNMTGGGGRDRLVGGRDDDALRGNGGRDRLKGSADDDFLSGGRGNDVLIGGRDDDDLRGGRGSDRFVLGEGEDTVLDFTVGTDILDIRRLRDLPTAELFLDRIEVEDGMFYVLHARGAVILDLTLEEVEALTPADFLT